MPLAFRSLIIFCRSSTAMGINPGKRLVQQNERWVDAQSSSDLDSATLSAGESVSAILADVLQPKLIDKLFHLLPALMPGDRLRFEDGQDVFLDRQFAEDGSLLREIADTVPGFEPGDTWAHP